MSHPAAGGRARTQPCRHERCRAHRLPSVQPRCHCPPWCACRLVEMLDKAPNEFRDYCDCLDYYTCVAPDARGARQLGGGGMGAAGGAAHGHPRSSARDGRRSATHTPACPTTASTPHAAWRNRRSNAQAQAWRSRMALPMPARPPLFWVQAQPQKVPQGAASPGDGAAAQQDLSSGSPFPAPELTAWPCKRRRRASLCGWLRAGVGAPVATAGLPPPLPPAAGWASHDIMCSS